MDYYLLMFFIILTVGIVVIFQIKRKYIKVIIVFLIVMVSWYIQFLRKQYFNKLAWEEFSSGLRANEPMDGASNAIIALFGWLPGVLYLLLVWGCYMLFYWLYKKYRQKKNTGKI